MNSTIELRAIRVDLAAALDKLDALLDADATPSPAAAALREMPRTKAIEFILRNANGKSLRPVEIWAALTMAGRDDPKMEVQVTTFDLWQRGRIGKTGRGQYCAEPDTSRM